ncbi:MAG: hypothetical protein GC131_04145 [Alphaproteobacteria bacterium]|nr:hypothetical protein [Alphaproteobacteria bacterium]
MPDASEKPHILFATDLDNGWAHEDLATIDFLRRYYNVEVSGLDGLEALEDATDLTVIRNIWPYGHDEDAMRHYNAMRYAMRERQKTKRLKVYNPLSARCDMWGKGYLVDLTRAGFPVIPTVRHPDDIEALGSCERYRLKDINGFSSIGQQTVAAGELGKVWQPCHVIQPELDFVREISCIFIDQEYFFSTEHTRVEKDDQKRSYPSAQVIDLARHFVAWNDIPHGIQRIDILDLNDGRNLLLEIEDDSPYLALNMLEDDLRDAFYRALHASLNEALRA